MRKVDYDQFRNEIERQNRQLSRARTTRRIRTKPRDPEELRNLLKLALIRKQKALASRQYEVIGPRRWRVNATENS